MPYMYIVECSDGTYYTGCAKELEQRIAKHNAGTGAKYTKYRRPVVLVYQEEYSEFNQALSREKVVQGWSRSKKQGLIESSLPKQ